MRQVAAPVRQSRVERIQAERESRRQSLEMAMGMTHCCERSVEELLQSAQEIEHFVRTGRTLRQDALDGMLRLLGE